jgi:N-acetylmuramoyl-L-alanine amidase
LKLNRKIYLAFFLTVFLVAITCPRTSSALTARDKYYKAESCYKKLRNSAKKKKYRHNWLTCIEKFLDVYRHNPSGAWASAGLYKTGELYQSLYKRSHKPSDKQEALDIYERIIQRFPKSKYKRKAEKAIRNFSKNGKKKPASKKARYSESTARNKYLKAESCYKKLRNSAKKKKYRENWLACIEKYQAVYQYHPEGVWAAAGLYKSGVLYQALYKLSHKPSDKQEALDIYKRIIQDFPRSDYRLKAEDAIRNNSQNGAPKTASNRTSRKQNDVKTPANPPEYQTARNNNNKAFIGKEATVKGLRFWSNPSYTRVVIDADNEMRYTHRLLKKDPSIRKPQRLYVDLDNSKLGQDIEKRIPINDNLLSDVRAGQHTSDLVRVVIDIKSFKTYKIFSLKNPFRIVIDVWGTAAIASRPSVKTDDKDAKIPTGALAKQLSLGVSRIIIDPGHGGSDFGAPGYLKGVHEKDVVLKIARRLAKKIREKLDCEVIMTRNSDQYLTLEERTAIANTKNADLFISIHTNAARDRRAYGIMTFFLNLATDDDAILVAARENATSTKNISDLQTILSDLMQNAKINESSRLAAHVQESLHGHLRKYYSRVKNKGVKQAPFYVLLGAQMPAILIETAFISNSRECKRLINAKYQDRMCDAIVNGIKVYIKETNPTAFMNVHPQKNSKG